MTARGLRYLMRAGLPGQRGLRALDHQPGISDHLTEGIRSALWLWQAKSGPLVEVTERQILPFLS